MRKINELCLQWDHSPGCSYVESELPRSEWEKGSYFYALGRGIVGVPAHPSEHLEALW